MPLSTANLVPLTHYVKTTDISQFYDLLTGAMTDQPVTLANALNLTKAGTALSVTNNASIGGTLTVTGNSAFGSLSSGVITASAIDAASGQVRSLVNGLSGGFLAGNVVGAPDVQWYRSAADTWRTPDSVVIDVALTVTGAASAGTFATGSTAVVGSTLSVVGNVGFNGQAPAARQTYTATNVSTDRSYDANATTTDELADVLGTLIADLRTIGLVS